MTVNERIARSLNAMLTLAAVMAVTVPPAIAGDGVFIHVAPGRKLATIYHNLTPRSKTEGPVAAPDGTVFFTDPYAGVIYHWGPLTGFGVYTDRSGGANGLFLDSKGRLIGCLAYARQVAVIGIRGVKDVISGGPSGKRFNEPNDLFIDTRGGIYISDPFWRVHDEPLDLDVEGVWYLPPGGGEPRLVIDDLVSPNGMYASPDGSLFYVIDSKASATYVWRVGPDGALSDRRLFAGVGIDGLVVDSAGNVYITVMGGDIAVFSPGGDRIDSLTLDEQPANLCFGGPDLRTLYIAAGRSMYAVDIVVPGHVPGWQK